MAAQATKAKETPTQKQVDRGRFVWYELYTTDMKAALEFYGKVIGWGTKKWDATSEITPPEYTMWMAGDQPVGGVMLLPEEAKKMGAPPHWMAYIAVPDVDATAKKAKSLGAKVYVEPETIPEVGRFAVIADPDGAVFAAMTPDGPYTPETDPQPLGFSWNELFANDWKKADRFYTELFGWKPTQDMDMGPEMGTYHMFGRDRFMYGGMMNNPKDAPAPPHWLHYVLVDSADAAAERAKQAGGQVIMGPMDVPGNDRVAVILDAQGAALGLHAKGPQHGKK
jgi:predicted enzyme related to lactoylglutathione lyase